METKPNFATGYMEVWLTYPLGSEPVLVATMKISSLKSTKLTDSWRNFMKQFLNAYVDSIKGSDLKFGEQRAVAQEGQNRGKSC